MAQKIVRTFKAPHSTNYPYTDLSVEGNGMRPKAIGAFLRRITPRAVIDYVIVARSLSDSVEWLKDLHEDSQGAGETINQTEFRDKNFSTVTYSEATQKYRATLSLTQSFMN